MPESPEIALAAIYGAEKSFYAEYASYVSSMDAIGYVPEGQRRFYLVGWAASHGSTITGYSGGVTTGSWSAVNNTFACASGSASSIPSGLTGDVQTFLVGASGCIRQGAANFDNWNINHLKVLNNNLINL